MPVFRQRNTSSYSKPPVTASTADSSTSAPAFQNIAAAADIAGMPSRRNTASAAGRIPPCSGPPRPHHANARPVGQTSAAGTTRTPPRKTPCWPGASRMGTSPPCHSSVSPKQWRSNGPAGYRTQVTRCSYFTLCAVIRRHPLQPVTLADGVLEQLHLVHIPSSVTVRLWA